MAFVDKAIKGIKWTALSNLIGGILQLLQIFILSKYLSPSEFGIIAIILVIIGFSQIFMDMGISNAIIHKQDTTREQLSTLYWINILSGLFLFSTLNLLSTFIANFYNIDDLANYIHYISFIYVIIPFGQQFLILMQKNMQFDKIAKIDIISHLVGVLTLITLIHIDFRIFSFIYGTLSFFIVRTLLLLITGIKIHKPLLYFKPKDVIFFIKFGLYQLGEKLINYFNTEIDTLIIGKILGTHSLGLYSLVKQLILRPIQFINPIVTKVFFPLMAKYQQNNRIVSKIYMSIIKHISLIMFPIYWTMFFMSNEILSLFGEQWTEAEMILKVMSIYGIFRSIGNPVGALLMAKGRVEVGFYWNLSLLFIIPMFVYIGSLYGITGVSISLLCLGIILYLPNWYFQVYKICGIPLKSYTVVFLKFLLISFLVVALINNLLYNLLLV